jgi:hypothetical protein
MKVNNVTWKKEGVPCTAAKYYYLKPSEGMQYMSHIMLSVV